MAMLAELILATTNRHKQEEFERLLAGRKFWLRALTEFADVRAMPEGEPSCRGNADAKAQGYARQLQRWVLADDTGLEVQALNGEPGVRAARYAGPLADAEANRRLLLQNLADVEEHERTARFVCALSLADSNGEIVARAVGQCVGRVLSEPVGTGGCGYDSLFVPDGFSATLAELGWETTLQISHRSHAVRQLLSCHPEFFGE